MEQTNLWNIGEGRTAAVVRFVNELQPHGGMSVGEQMKFIDLKIRALTLQSNDAMLEAVGYVAPSRDNPNPRPAIYHWVRGIEAKVR